MRRDFDRRPTFAILPHLSVLILLPVLLALLGVTTTSTAQQLVLRTPAERGGRALAFAPDGRLGELVREMWTDASGAFQSVRLRYRERGAAPGSVPGEWETVLESTMYASEEILGDSHLRFDADSNASVLLVERTWAGTETIRERRRLDGTWTGGASWPMPPAPGPFSFESTTGVAFADRADGGFDVVVRRSESGFFASWTLQHATLVPGGGTPAWIVVDFGGDTILSAFDWPTLRLPANPSAEVHGFGYVYDPRNLAIATGPDGTRHIVYSVSQTREEVAGGTFVWSELYYASIGPDGQMSEMPSEPIVSPGEAGGDGGLGASIAIAPDGTVAVASAFLPRAFTGSPGACQLRYLYRLPDGSWNSSVVTGSADGYQLGDGPRGTGLEPQLVFDPQSRPSIAFTDHASYHAPGVGAISYSGQVRLATRASPTAGAWTLSKAISRGSASPMDFVTFRPAIAVRTGRMAISATSWTWVAGQTRWNPVYEIVFPGGPTVSGVSPVSGPQSGGTTITITGTGLAGASVSVGGVAASVTASSATSVTAVTPPGVPGPRDVSVTTATGDAVRTGAFTYVAAPDSASASDGTSTTGVTISWTASPGATGYRVLRANPGGSPVSIATPAAAATSFIDSSATAGVTYAYSVAARTASSDTAPSSPDPGWRNLPAPTGVTATDGTRADGVGLTWNPVAGALGYRVEREASGEPNAVVGTATASSFVDAGAATGVTYTYRVRTVTAAGDSAAAGGPDSGWRAPAPPISVVASDGDSTSAVTITWPAVPDATGYRVFRRIGTGTPIEISTGNLTATTWIDTTAVPGTLYGYLVRSRSAAGDSAPSGPDQGWRNLPAPSGLSASDGTITNGVQLAWTGIGATTGLTGYRVYRTPAGGGSTMLVTTVGPNVAAYLDAGAPVGVPLVYSVRCASAAGESSGNPSDAGWRNLAPPAGVLASDGTSTAGVTVSWTAVTGVLGYQVLRGSNASDLETIGTASIASFLDATGVPGTVYQYAVRTITAGGASATSATNAGWRNLVPVASVAATDGTSTTAVSVTWSPVPGAATYAVLRAIGTGTPSVVSPAGFAGTSLNDTTAAPGTVYRYSVRARLAAGDSFPSDSNDGWRNVPPPNNLVASTTLATGVNLTWTSSPGATGYRVFRVPSGGTPIEIAAPAASPFLDATAEVGVSHAYQVRARTAGGDSAPSGIATGVRTMPAPGGILASDGTSSNGIVVTWNPIPGVATYQVLRAAGTAVPNEQVGEVTSGNSFADATVAPGTIHNYSVRAVLGGVASAPGTPNGGWRNLPAPTGLVAGDGSAVNGVPLSWNAIGGATGYRIFRAAGSAAPTQIAQVGPTVVSYLDASAVAGTTYTYTVRAFTAPGNSDASLPETGWRNVAPPANLAATDGTLATGVNVTWTASAGATGYRVFRSESGGSPVELAAPAASPYLDTTAIPGVGYLYTAKARTPSGDSLGQSNSDAGSRGMPAPTGVAAGDGTSTDGVPVTWNAVPGATEYRVHRSGTASPVGTVTGTSFLDLPPAVGTVYTYTVRAFSGPSNLLSAASAGDGGWRNVPAPDGVAATDGSLTTGVSVGWIPVSPAGGITGYRVFRSTGGSAAIVVGSPAANVSTFLDTSAVAGTAYTYTVRAATAAGTSGAGAGDPGWRDAAAPTSMTASDGSSDAHVAISWPAIAGAVGYSVYRGESATSLVEIAVATGATFNDSTAIPGAKRFYQVAARFAAGTSTRRSPTNDGWRNVPFPAGFAAGDGASTAGVPLSWTPVEHATGYRIFRAAGSGAPTTPLAEITDPAASSYLDATVAGSPAGTTFNYLIKAKTSLGDSAASPTNTGWRNLPAPTGLTAGDGTLTTGVSLSWLPIGTLAGHTGYRVYRQADATAPVPVATLPVTATAFTDTAVAAGVVFSYSVRSVTVAGESIGNPVDAGWRNIAAPTGVAASENDPIRVRVSWLPSAGASILGYAVFRQFPGEDPEEIAFVPVPATTVDDTTIPIGVTAIYSVRARTAAGLTASSPGDPGMRPLALAGASSGERPGGSPSNAFEVADGLPGGMESLDGNTTPSAGGRAIGDGTGLAGDSARTPGLAIGPDGIDDLDACPATIARIEHLLDGEHETAWPGRIGLSAELARLLDADPFAEDGRPLACRMRSGDINLDGVADGADLAAFLAAWSNGDPIAGDLDRDGVIDENDLDLVISGMLGGELTGAARSAPARSPRGP